MLLDSPRQVGAPARGSRLDWGVQRLVLQSPRSFDEQNRASEGLIGGEGRSLEEVMGMAGTKKKGAKKATATKPKKK